MSYKLFVLLAVILWSAMTLPFQKEASAETALNRAVVQNIRNLVRLIPRNRTARPARVSDAMKPGDALSTGRSSLAELRFNDGSLARIGEQAVFRFLAKTRNFNLSNGTILLLIPPGRGRTGIQTPNAAAAIRGSALFVRYIPGTNTTIVGSLTDSKIEVFNEGGSQSEVLEAGQMAVIVEDKIENLYEFDLNTFYETSDLVQELNLDKPSGEASPDPAIASVQAETSEAAAAQPPITGAGVIENPAFVKPPATSVAPPIDNSTTRPTPVNPPVNLPVNPPVGPPVNLPVNPPVEPPVNPPIENPPVENPPVENPPVENPPVENPPIETPPVETPPVENPPIETPPVENPPIETPPVENPPIETPPVENPPVENPPVENPPIETPPVENPPVENPPVENPPIETPPVENPPVENPPVENPPVENPPDNTQGKPPDTSADYT